MMNASPVAVCLLRPQCQGQHTFQESDMPARSRLYSLAPYNIDTIWRESLTGYINRLGWTHHISPRAFVAEMILPPLTTDLGLRLPTAAAFGADGAMSLNGTGDLASAGGALLNHLTMRTDLHLLTLSWWVGDLPRRGQLRATPAWCPVCLAKWKGQGQPLYQPLLWMFRIVTMCPRHQSPLQDRCPFCQKRQMILATNTTQPGACTSCGTFLGENPKSFSAGPEHEQQMAWQAWVISVLEELLTTSQADGQLHWEPFFSYLATYLKEHQAYSKLARVTGITRQALHHWVKSDDPYAPTFQTLLQFCYVCNVTPLQVMRNHLGPLQQIDERATARNPFRSQRPVRRIVDRERCQAVFQAVLDGKEEALGTSQVAQRLGYDEHSLMERFPQECAEITRRAKAYRKQRKEQRLVLMREQVKQATLTVRASDVYPSLDAVQALLPSGTMRMQEARVVWRTTLRELGF